MPLNQAQARENLRRLLNDYEQLSADERKTMSEASVVRQFIDRLLRDVLGWPIEDPKRYKYEMHTQVGRPDLTLLPESGGVIFVEAKRFGAIKEMEQARYTVQGVITPGQMALPGLSVDRTPEEQQAINYAFANGGTWAILTNFERLRLFNARRDWLVLSFERPGAFISEFDQLWQLSYESVLNGSLDALSNQRYARDIDGPYLDFVNEWRERLAQDAIQRRELNRWAFQSDGGIDLPRLRAAVQRFLDRLVIARFAEDWLVIPPGTLRQFYELNHTNIYSPNLDYLLDYFFYRFDRQHNSALFAPGLADVAIFSDGVLRPLLDKLYEVRYRAMPADILGNTYEQYLGKALVIQNGGVTTRDNLETRKKQGSYYTPQVIVQYIVDHSLGRYLYGTENGKPDGQPIPGESRKTSRDLSDLRVLDSACGSGSFLIYAYYVLAGFYEDEIERLKAARDAKVQDMARRFAEITIDDRLEAERIDLELKRLDNYPRLILETHLYGVDLDPQAAEIATVNLMMRALEGKNREKLLPLILGQSVKVGNGLVGLGYAGPALEEHRAALTELLRLRALLQTDPDADKAGIEPDKDEYARMTLEEAARIPNPKARERAIAAVQARNAAEYVLPDFRDEAHATYYTALDTAEALSDQLNTALKPHFTDLARVRPFHWGVEFPEAFYNPDGTLKDNPGFTIIFGNPPWEILKPDLREFYAQFDENIGSKLTRAQAEARIAELDAEDPRRREAFDLQTQLTEETAAYVRTVPDYVRQGRGDIATHKLFLERMYSLLQTDGRLGYVVPSGIYADLGTKELREMLLNEGGIQYLFSFSNERGFFPGVHHSFKFTMLGAKKGEQNDGFWGAFRFNPRVAVSPDDLPAFLDNPDNLIYVQRDSIQRFSPDSLSVMEFQSAQDYAVAEKIYDGWPMLGDEISDLWNLKLNREFDMTNDRALFNQNHEGYPLYEGKMIYQYDAFYAEPKYWVSKANTLKHFKNRQNEGTIDVDLPRLGFREITFATNERTLIATILPPHTCCNHKISVISPRLSKYSEAEMTYCLGVFNSLVLDYVARFKVTSGMSMFHFYQLPVPRLTAGNRYFDAVVERAARLVCTRAAFAGLWQSVMGSAWEPSPPAPLPQGEGSLKTPAFDGETRQRLRDEIDGLVAHLYGLTRDEFDHILGTFPLVFPDSEAGRERRLAVLRAYDGMEM